MTCHAFGFAGRERSRMIYVKTRNQRAGLGPINGDVRLEARFGEFALKRFRCKDVGQ